MKSQNPPHQYYLDFKGITSGRIEINLRIFFYLAFLEFLVKAYCSLSHFSTKTLVNLKPYPVGSKNTEKESFMLF